MQDDLGWRGRSALVEAPESSTIRGLLFESALATLVLRFS